jgi:homopolymeric O-antigen transport system permease protein
MNRAYERARARLMGRGQPPQARAGVSRLWQAPMSPTHAGTRWRSRRLVHRRDLLHALVLQDMKVRYNRSMLGVAWSLFNPLLQLLVYYFIFRSVLVVTTPNYLSFLITGLFAWNWFNGSLIVSTGAIVNNRDLVRQPGFPAAMLPAATVASHLVHFLLAFPILLLCLFLDGRSVTPALLALPLPLALQFLLTLGLAYLAATFHVTFRDTQYILAVLLQLLLFLTPVFYDASLVPARYQTLYHLNPMLYLLDAYRAILIRGEFPNWSSLLLVGLLSGALLSVGSRTFARASHDFVDEL